MSSQDKSKSPLDAKGGGDLFDMAKDGTTVPADAAVPRLIPSVPGPEPKLKVGGEGAEGIVADNAVDIPRSTTDKAAPQEILTGTGDTLPAQTDSKRLHDVPGGVVHDPAAKGSTRYEKHHRQKGGDVEFGAGKGPGIEEGGVVVREGVVDRKEVP